MSETASQCVLEDVNSQTLMELGAVLSTSDAPFDDDLLLRIVFGIPGLVLLERSTSHCNFSIEQRAGLLLLGESHWLAGVEIAVSPDAKILNSLCKSIACSSNAAYRGLQLKKNSLWFWRRFELDREEEHSQRTVSLLEHLDVAAKVGELFRSKRA